mmetsp:Transcript_3034/g.4449  ORF Transcript_3034/g.4449 Transcript_3034/m.4449 type:complete len:321 (+) Transcript_3034:85-1047(+)
MGYYNTNGQDQNSRNDTSYNKGGSHKPNYNDNKPIVNSAPPRPLTPLESLALEGMYDNVHNFPPAILNLFKSRSKLPFLPPPEKKAKQTQPFTGVSEFLKEFDDPNKTLTEEQRKELLDDFKEPESVYKRRTRIEKENKAKAASKLMQARARWNPHEENARHTSNPYATLFVARLPYEVDEKELHDIFSQYGSIKGIRLVREKTVDEKPSEESSEEEKKGKSRGYAFIEYDEVQSMNDAYRHTSQLRIRNVPVLVDYERARTIKSWLPRRLGGGLGDTRAPFVRKYSKAFPSKRGRHARRNSNYRGGGGSRGRPRRRKRY